MLKLIQQKVIFLDIKEFLKYELSGWKKSEIIRLVFAFGLIFINAIVFKDSTVAIISAICGILYTILAGKGKISCYFFGLCGSGCYSYLSLNSALFGNLFLYLCYYIPMQILGIFKWKKHLKRETLEIEKTQLSIKEQIIISVLSIVLSIGVIFLLKYLNDGNPFIDGITTVLSITGMYLTVKRCIEQWFIWIIVNGLSFIMWFDIVLNGTKAYATLVMWGFYFVLAIYFYFVWKKEIKKDTKQP